MNTIEKIRQENLKADLPEMNVGDTVQVGVRIIEGGKERIQNFSGVICIFWKCYQRQLCSEK